MANLEAAAQRGIVKRHHIARAAGGSFNHVNECQLQRREPVKQQVEQALGVAILSCVVGGSHR